MDPTNINAAAFSGYDLSSDNETTIRHRSSSDHANLHKVPHPTGFPPRHASCTFDHDRWSYPIHDTPITTTTTPITTPNSHTTPNNTTAMATPPPFEIPKLWREAMQCVSINANLYPQQILHKYLDLFPSQSVLHPGHVDLDVWRSRRATERGVRLVQVRYLGDDPARIYLMVIFIDATDPATGQPVVRLVTNTSIAHVLEEPCANCPLWLKVHTDVKSRNDSPYHIVPCCEGWADSVDFDRPISAEEKQVPAVVARLIEEVKKKNALLHVREQVIEAKEKEVEEKDALLKHMTETTTVGKEQEVKVVEASPGVERVRLHEIPVIDMEMLEKYWWVAAIVAIFLMVLILK